MTIPGNLIGQVLEDRYRIRRLIGRGGMGAVYEAEAIRLGRLCAVKVLLPEFTRSEQAVQRFRREAHVAARVKHPNVVEIFDTGTTGDGAGYIAMELLEGESLDRTLRREGRLPWPRVRHMAVQICRALAAAHDQKIVHRDMKPENCFRVRRDGDDDIIKVLDFGIAKLTDVEPTPDAPRLTATNSVVGTYAYMAFEQVAGRDCDHRVDIWATGVMIYELLTGFLPFRGQNQGQIWSAIFQDDPEAMQHVAPDAGIPDAVEHIVRQALAKDRKHRFASADALARALLGASDGGAAPRVDDPTLRRVRTAKIDVEGATHGLGAEPTQLTPTPIRRNQATVPVDPQALTALAADEIADTDEGRPTLQVSPPARPERLATAVAEPAPHVPPPAATRRKLSRRALLFFGSLGAPAALLAVILSGGPRELEPEASPVATAAPPPPPLAAPVVAPPPEEAKLETKAEEPPRPPPQDPVPEAKTTTPKGDGKTTPKKSNPPPREPFARRVALEMHRVKTLVKNKCDGLLQSINVEIEVSAATGRAIKAQTLGLARAAAVSKCIEREIKNYMFPRGSADEPNYKNTVQFESR